MATTWRSAAKSLPDEETLDCQMHGANTRPRLNRSSRRRLGYTDYRDFEQVVRKARMACFNSGQRVEDHFVDSTEMIAIFGNWAARCRKNCRRPTA
jgi:hypothetical protein